MYDLCTVVSFTQEENTERVVFSLTVWLNLTCEIIGRQVPEVEVSERQDQRNQQDCEKGATSVSPATENTEDSSHLF